MSAITNLEPRIVWEQFDAITRVPRPSKKEGRIIEFLVDFARKHNLEYKKDAIGNVVMRKPATPGFENRPTVILQSHMDMVCEKNSDVEFDFDRDPIRTRIDGGWVRAEGTTLGADCGIGMAAALAVLIDPAVEHGPVEALFTVDEETGLTGAFELGEDMLTGKYLVNLDSEDEGEIFIGCAGGIDTVATFRYTMEEAPKNYAFFRVDVSDLQGGHSGDDIDKGRVNSNKTVARLLWDGMQSYELKLSWFDGGNLRNAIPREAYAIFGVPVRFKDEFIKRYKLFAADLEAEFRLREPNFKITLNEMPQVDRVLDARTQFGLVYSLVGVPNGVIAMSFAVPGLVETSTNLASVKFVGDDRIVVTSSQRSSVESAKTYVMQMVESVFALAGADVAHSDGYPGWTPDPQSALLAKTVDAYKRLFGADPKVRAIHAAPRRAFARRTARNRHGSQILGPAARSAENRLIPAIILLKPGDFLKRSPGFVSFGRQRVYVSFEIDDIMTGISSVDMHEAGIRIFIQYDYQFFVLPFLSAVYFHAKLYVAVFFMFAFRYFCGIVLYIPMVHGGPGKKVRREPDNSFIAIHEYLAVSLRFSRGLAAGKVKLGRFNNEFSFIERLNRLLVKHLFRCAFTGVIPALLRRTAC